MGNLVVAFKVFEIVASVELLAQVFAHLVYLVYRLREADVGLFRVLEADWAQDL